MQDHVRSHAISAAGRGYSSDNSFITHQDIKRFVKRYAKTIVVCTLIGALIASAYVFTATPLYTARTQIIIDPSIQQATQQGQQDRLFTLDNAQVESQLEVLRSEKIAAAVVDKLKLQNEPEFGGTKPSLLRRLINLIKPSSSQMTDYERQRLAMGLFEGGLVVNRVGLSYAIDILYTSPNPELAAKVANATADAYIAEQISARAQAARAGGRWLEERIDQLRKQMNDAALQAKEFRARRDYRLAPEVESTTRVGRQDSKDRREPTSRVNTIEELEATAQTYRRIYESYLSAYTESVQKQSYPISNARVITGATPPPSKSHPRSKLILVFGCMMGGIAGLGIAFFRYSIDRSIWDPQQIREEIGVECLANIPQLVSHAPLSTIERAMLGKASMERMVKQAIDDPSKSVSSGVSTITTSLFGQSSRSGISGKGTIAVDRGVLVGVISAPFSGFSHGIKTLKTAISLAGRARQIRCIAITSALPNEGKTTVAANLATLFALSGVRTLLVDTDLRNASLSRLLAPDAEIGILEAMTGEAELGACLVRANDSGLHMLPAPNAGHAAHSDELLSSERARTLIEVLRDAYEMVIFELPPLTVGLEGLAISSLLDGTVIVAEWGKTPLPLVAETAHLLRNARADILGVALNKVDASAIHYGDVASNYMSYGAPSPSPYSQPRRDA